MCGVALRVLESFLFPNTDQFLFESGLEHPESFLIRMPIGEDSPLKPMLLAIWKRSICRRLGIRKSPTLRDRTHSRRYGAS
jgi:hypothetical protein